MSSTPIHSSYNMRFYYRLDENIKNKLISKLSGDT